MHRSIKIIIPIIVGCLAVAWAYAGTISGTASLTVATPTPTGGPTPSPPTLVNAQIFSPGSHTYGGTNYTVHGNGSTDDTAAFYAALAAGDLDVKPGTYLLSSTTWTPFAPASGRNILCENPSLPPVANGAGANATVIFKVPGSSGNWNILNDWANGTLYGCEIEGMHFPNTTWSSDSAGSIQFIGLFQGSGFKAYNNGVDGWGGITGPFTMNINCNGTASDCQGKLANGTYATNDDISWNRFSDCNVRAVEIDYGKNIRITHNVFYNCPDTAEIQDWHYTGMSALFDSNTFTFTTQNNGTSPWSHYASGGQSCLSAVGTTSSQSKYCPGVAANTCSSSCAPDYSGNTFSNNIINGSIPCYIVVNNAPCNGFPSGGMVPGVYRGNTVSGCTETCGPGNANSNSWGAGGNQSPPYY